MSNSTRSNKLKQVSDSTMVVGVDIGSEKNYARAMDWRGQEYTKKAFFFRNHEDGFESFIGWMEDLKAKSGKKDVLIGCEPTAGYWLRFQKYLVDRKYKLVLVNTLHVHRTKELDDNSPSKDDKKDPRVIADLVREGRFSEPYIAEDSYGEIRSLYKDKESIQKEQNRVANQIQDWLYRHFPEYLKCYSDFDAKGGLALLEVAPMPSDVYKLGVEGILQVWRDAGLRHVGGRKKAEQLYEAAATNQWFDEFAGERIRIKYLLEDYKRNRERLEEINRQLEERIREVPNVDKLLAIPGVGMGTVIGFIAEVGDVSRFTDGRQLVKYAGMNPTNNESCKKVGEHRISKCGRKILRKVMYEAAGALTRWNSAFRSLAHKYISREDNPLNARQTRVAVGCKALRVFYAILSKGIDFDPEKVACTEAV